MFRRAEDADDTDALPGHDRNSRKSSNFPVRFVISGSVSSLKDLANRFRNLTLLFLRGRAVVYQILGNRAICWVLTLSADPLRPHLCSLNRLPPEPYGNAAPSSTLRRFLEGVSAVFTRIYTLDDTLR